MQQIIWRHFRLGIPDDWEMVLFSRGMQTGRCTFADRYQHRLELNWRQVANPPDFPRMLADYRAALLPQHGDEDAPPIAFANVAAWHGLIAVIDGVVTSRFGRYFPGEGCLLEMVFLWPEQRNEQLEKEILSSVAEEPVGKDGLRRWRAFGMTIRVPDDRELLACNVEPGRARLAFGQHRRSPAAEIIFERLGMVAQWLHVPVDAWLRGSLPKTVRLRSQSSYTQAGHDIAVVIGDQPSNCFARIMGQRLAYEAQAWICPVDGRLYSISTIAAPEQDGKRTAKPRLTCCRQFEGAP